MDHIDSDPLNDDIANLQVLSKAENASKDVVRRTPEGMLYKNSGAKITDKESLRMSGALNEGRKSGRRWLSYVHTPYGVFESLRLAAKAEGVHHATIDKRIKSINFPEYRRSSTEC